MYSIEQLERVVLRQTVDKVRVPSLVAQALEQRVEVMIEHLASVTNGLLLRVTVRELTRNQQRVQHGSCSIGCRCVWRESDECHVAVLLVKTIEGPDWPPRDRNDIRQVVVQLGERLQPGRSGCEVGDAGAHDHGQVAHSRPSHKGLELSHLLRSRDRRQRQARNLRHGSIEHDLRSVGIEARVPHLAHGMEAEPHVGARKYREGREHSPERMRELLA